MNNTPINIDKALTGQVFSPSELSKQRTKRIINRLISEHDDNQKVIIALKKKRLAKSQPIVFSKNKIKQLLT